MHKMIFDYILYIRYTLVFFSKKLAIRLELLISKYK